MNIFMIKYLFSILVWMVALLSILLAHSPTLGLGDYMCCVHVKASKPSPPQSWSDCTIIPLTLSSTPPAMRPPFSQDAGCILPDQQSSAVPSREGQTTSTFVSSPPRSLDHLGVDPLAHHQFMESGILTGVRIFQNKCFYFYTLVYFKRNRPKEHLELLFWSLRLNSAHV